MADTPTHGDPVERKLASSAGLNAVIVVAEVVGGLLSGSLALLSDAMHNLSDVAALAIAWGTRRLGRRPPSLQHTYGLGRAEVLSALFNAATILVVCTLITREAIVRLAAPQPVHGALMLTVAVVGLVGNLASVLLLRGHGHGDLNVRGAFLHLLQDTVSSVLVVVAALLSDLRFGPYLDPVVSLLVVLFVLRSSWDLLRSALHILLEGTPAGLDLTALAADLQTRFDLRDVHHLHVWELSGGTRLLTAHLRLAEMPLAEAEALLQRIEHHLAHAWRIAHATLQPELTACEAAGLLHPDSLQTSGSDNHVH